MFHHVSSNPTPKKAPPKNIFFFSPLLLSAVFSIFTLLYLLSSWGSPCLVSLSSLCLKISPLLFHPIQSIVSVGLLRWSTEGCLVKSSYVEMKELLCCCFSSHFFSPLQSQRKFEVKLRSFCQVWLIWHPIKVQDFQYSYKRTDQEVLSLFHFVLIKTKKTQKSKKKSGRNNQIITSGRRSWVFFMTMVLPQKRGDSVGWSDAVRMRWIKRQNQSAPNLIFSPAGFERTTLGRVGAASVPSPRVVCVRGRVFVPVI